MAESDLRLWWLVLDLERLLNLGRAAGFWMKIRVRAAGHSQYQTWTMAVNQEMFFRVGLYGDEMLSLGTKLGVWAVEETEPICRVCTLRFGKARLCFVSLETSYWGTLFGKLGSNGG